MIRDRLELRKHQSTASCLYTCITMEGTNSQGNNSALQENEIANIRDTFKGVCRVIKDLGDFTYVVTLQPNGMDLTLKFQLTKDYPTVRPTLIIKSSVLREIEVQKLQISMEDAVSSVTGTPMILRMVGNMELWAQENAVNLKKQNTKTSGKYDKAEKGRNREKRKLRKEQQEAEETANEKKASMKTADDVIKRILWDTKLIHDDFLVGYIDRFTGLQEKYFTSFSWEDLATVDYTVLAIPKHRIEYFKYKDIKIWDKNQRIDNVFGSLGSKLTIYDVIENYEKEKEQREAPDTCYNNAEYQQDNAESSDDDSDDGFTITVGNQGSGVGTTTSSTYDTSVMTDEEDFDDEEDDFDKYWRNKLRPNFFLALRIMDEEVQKTIEAVQDIILEHEPQFDECRMLPQNLHITLCTLGLDTPEQVSHCVEVLKRLQPEFQSLLPSKSSRTPIKIQGVDQFFNRVVYAKANFSQKYLDFVDHVKLCLQNEGIAIRDNHDFVPHMTIMKITRPVGNRTGKKYIAPWIYAEKSDLEFGYQMFDNMHLCEMGPSRREDGFYMTAVSLEL